MADQHRGIVTPEAVVLEFETAGVASRSLAFGADLFLQLMVYGLLSTVVLLTLGFVGDPTVLVVAQLIVAFAVLLGYPVVFETFMRGRTPGKAMGGLRVVTLEGAPVRFRHASLRAVFMVAEIYMTFGSIAVTSIVFSRSNQRLGDLFAGTIVIHERTGEARAIAVRFPAPLGYEEYVTRLDTAAISRDQYLVIRRYLMRVNELTAQARADLAERLAGPTAEMLRSPRPTELTPELFLACVASAYQLRNGAPPLPWERLPGHASPAPPPLPPPGYPKVSNPALLPPPPAR